MTVARCEKHRIQYNPETGPCANCIEEEKLASAVFADLPPKGEKIEPLDKVKNGLRYSGLIYNCKFCGAFTKYESEVCTRYRCRKLAGKAHIYMYK